MLILQVQNKPSSNIYFDNLLNNGDNDLAAIYMLPCLVTHNACIRSFFLLNVRAMSYFLLKNFIFLE